jgi:hypothetical protein
MMILQRLGNGPPTKAEFQFPFQSHAPKTENRSYNHVFNALYDVKSHSLS